MKILRESESAFSGTCGENVNWQFDGTGILTISGTGDMVSYSLENSPWKSFRARITSVVIEDGVTSIADGAFCYCTSLADVTVSRSVTRIGEYAFGHDFRLSSITIPNSETQIDTTAFYRCLNLSDIDASENITDVIQSQIHSYSQHLWR